MVSLFFINICIFVTFLYAAGFVFKRYEEHNLLKSVLSGILFGVLGVILMKYTIPVSDTTIVDLRHLAIIVVATYVGWIPSIITGVIIAVTRAIMFGVDQSSVMVGAFMIFIGVICAALSSIKTSNFIKINLMNLISMVIILITLLLSLDRFTVIFEIYSIHLLTSAVGGLIAYTIAENINRSNAFLQMLEQSIKTDHLTNLNNVRQFDHSFNKELENAKRNQSSLSMLLIDIDYFKQVNDTYGHPSGDLVLKELGSLLVQNSRNMDIVSRNGGEEFSVLLPNCPNDLALEIGERIRKAIESHTFRLPDGIELAITVSIGASTYPDTVTEIDHDIFDQADKALYHAKKTGRNKILSISEIQHLFPIVK